MKLIKTINYTTHKIQFFLHEEGEYISDLIRKDGMFYEIDHLELLNYLPINSDGIFLDIGANIGNHTLYFAKVLQREVYAFEPIKENFHLLQKNVVANKIDKDVKLFNIALSNKEKFSSMHRNVQNNSGTWSLGRQRGEINCKALDTIIGDETISYIKIDVEGEELKVLHGAQRTITTSKPIVSAEYHYGTEFKKIQDFLVKLGYHRALFIAGRSSNAIFIHSSVMNIAQLVALQNFILQLKSQNALQVQAKSSQPEIMHDTHTVDSTFEIKDDRLYDADIISSINVEKLIKDSRLIDSKTIQKNTKTKVIDIEEVATSIENKFINDEKYIIFNFTKKQEIGFYSLDIAEDRSISIDGEIIFKESVSAKVFNDILRYIVLNNKDKKFLILVDFVEEQLAFAHGFYELLSVEYGILSSHVPPLHWEKWTWLSNAKFIRTDCEETYNEFQKKYIFAIDYQDNIRVDRNDFKSYQARTEVAKHTKKKGLLISYFFTPAMSVGVFRPSYWFRNITRLSDDQIHIEVATAMQQKGVEHTNIHFIPDYGCVTSITIDVQTKTEHEKIKNSVNTIALSWKQSLEAYFDAHPKLKYDFVILTGNPFMHFDFSDYAKEKWDAVVIQDYRDTFGKNPRFYSKDPKITQRNEKLRQVYEDRFCTKADIVVTVNDWCAKDMSIFAPQPVEIIGNGYDDEQLEAMPPVLLSRVEQKYPSIHFKYSKLSRALQLLKKTKKMYSSNKKVIRLSYAGSFAHDRDPWNLILSVRNTLGYELHHFGTPYPKLSNISNNRIVSHGKTDYKEVLASLLYMDIGVVYASHDFESTTKIYDYIACDMIILIITSEENPKPYNLSKELEGIEHVHWIVNNEKALTDFLATTKFPDKIKRPQRENFSRKSRTKKLIELIKRSTDGRK